VRALPRVHKGSDNSSVFIVPVLRQSNFWKALTRSSSVSVLAMRFAIICENCRKSTFPVPVGSASFIMSSGRASRMLNLPRTLLSSAASMLSLPPENKLKAARSSCTWSSFKSTDVESRSSPPLLRAAFQLFSGGKDSIDAAELKRVLGKFNIRDARPEDMIKDADPTETGKVDFLQFSQMMAKRMAKTDTEDDLVKAFQKFDWRRTGIIKTEELAEPLTTLGKALTARELAEMLAVCEKDGQIQYMKFVQEMFGAKEEKEKQ